MPIKRGSVVLAALTSAWLCGTVLVPANAMTLQEALALTYETNPSLLASRAQLRASDENVSQANAAWRPTVTSSLSAGVSATKTERQGITMKDATGYPRTGWPRIHQTPLTRSTTTAGDAGPVVDVEAQRAGLYNHTQTH